MKLTHTETQTPHTHRVACTDARTRACTDAHMHTHTHTHTCSQVSVHTPTHIHTHTHTHTPTPPPPHTHTHTHTNPHTHTQADRTHLCCRTLNAPYPTLPAHPKGIIILKIITTTASQVPELLCQSTDWINCKFYSLWAFKMIQPSQIFVCSKSVSARFPLHRLWRSCRTL